MIHIKHTIQRHGVYYYNRRVPKKQQPNWGDLLRLRLSSDHTIAKQSVLRIDIILDDLWKQGSNSVPIDFQKLLNRTQFEDSRVSTFARRYIEARGVKSKHIILATRLFTDLVGDRHVESITRSDAHAFVSELKSRHNCSATIKRRIGSLCAVFNYALIELEIEKRNPFSRIAVKEENHLTQRRRTFTEHELATGYKLAWNTRNPLYLLLPIMGETGCRISEIVGLRKQDVCLENRILKIQPHPTRRLKNETSCRNIALVGQAYDALTLMWKTSDTAFIFPKYVSENFSNLDYAQKNFNTWLKKTFDGRTSHCLRHTFRDRLRTVECPIELIDQIGGWRTINGSGTRYGRGYPMSVLRKYMERIAIPNDK